MPEDFVKRFERCRKLFVYGLFAYEFFSVAAEYAELTWEAALRERIREKCSARIAWLDSDKPNLSSLIDMAIKEKVLTKEAAHRYSLKHDNPDEEEVKAAEAAGWTINTDPAVVKLRNHIAHARATEIIGPAMSRGVLEVLVSFINYLWTA